MGVAETRSRSYFGKKLTTEISKYLRSIIVGELSTHLAITEVGIPAATCSVMKVSLQLYGVVLRPMIGVTTLAQAR